MISLLLYATYLRMERFRSFDPVVNWPDLPAPQYDWDSLLGQKTDLESLLGQKEGVDFEEYFQASEEEKKWLSPDGRLKLVYPAGWITMDTIISQYSDEAGIMLEEAETLLFAFKLETEEQSLALLTVGEISSEKTLEDIKQGIGQNAKEHKGEAEITALATEDKTTRLEAIFKYPDKATFLSKGMVIFAEEKTYLIFLTASQKDWLQLKEEAESIFESVALLE